MNAVAHSIRLPTTQEELDRKALEALEWLIMQREAGEITNDQISTGMTVLFMTVSGMVDEEFLQLITAADTKYCRR